jgi:hypothetical protein
MTYDRAVTKFDEAHMRQMHRSLIEHLGLTLDGSGSDGP